MTDNGIGEERKKMVRDAWGDRGGPLDTEDEDILSFFR